MVYQGLPDKVYNVLHPSDNGYRHMVTVLQRTVPEGAIVASWEWEFSIESDRRIIYPPTQVVNVYTRYLMLCQRLPDNMHDAISSDPDYILVGSFGSWTKMYDRYINPRNLQLVARHGVYSLYRVVK
ncbi:MAG: hypothetical protein J7455_01335 [Roseiflexus sp.]|nr:hypothetical protein [Roseiflexus sp.]MBO9364360.1 hypothetical protein [Roseiflexus sp.]MBO9384083.1 hypothetical protein [Roseiflexus sp.]MBO9387886.1 hypothetical protein [Roseiflexus sp.]